MRRAVLLLLLACSLGCQRREACRRLVRDKLAAGPELAEEICTRPCEETARRYGFSEARCRWMQAGGEGEPP